MSNSHLQPSMAAETQSMFGDLLTPTLLSSSLAAPGGGMTLPAFWTTGYVRNGSPVRLVYVNQPAAPVTLAGGDGMYWLALMHDTHSAVAAWTRQAGTHYAWQAAGTQPADPAGGLVIGKLTVAGGSITVTDASPNYQYRKVAFGGPGGALAFDAELTYNETNNILTGRCFEAVTQAGDNRIGFYTNMALAGGTNRWALYAAGDAPVYLGGPLNVQGAAYVNGALTVSGHTILTTAQTGRIGIGYAAPATVWCRSGALTADSLGVNLGDSAPTYGLHVNSTAYVSGLVGMSRAPTAPWALCVGTANSLFADGTIYGVGLVDTATLNVRSTAVVSSTLQVNGSIGQGTAPVGGFGFYSLYNAFIGGAVGIGRGIAAPWTLCVAGTNSLYADGSIYAGGVIDIQTLFVRTGNSFFGGGVGIGWANEAGYWLTAANIKTGSVDWSGTSNGAHLTLGGNLTAANVIATTTLYGVSASLSGGITWSTPSTGTFLTLTGNLNCANAIATNNLYGVTAVMTGELQAASIVISSGQAYKVGGGPWIDSSARSMKRNITVIPDALGLLLEQRGRIYEWEEPAHAAALPGPRYGFVADEVTIEQWRTTTPEGQEALAIQGFEALTVEALRAIVTRVEAIERMQHAARGD